MCARLRESFSFARICVCVHKYVRVYITYVTAHEKTGLKSRNLVLRYRPKSKKKCYSMHFEIFLFSDRMTFSPHCDKVLSMDSILKVS